MSYIPLPLPAQGNTTANALSVETMFVQILGAVQKSVRCQFYWVEGPLNERHHSKPRYLNFAKNAQT